MKLKIQNESDYYLEVDKESPFQTDLVQMCIDKFIGRLGSSYEMIIDFGDLSLIGEAGKLIKAIRSKLAISFASDISSRFREEDALLERNISSRIVLDRKLLLPNNNQIIPLIMELSGPTSNTIIRRSDLGLNIDKKIVVSVYGSSKKDILAGNIEIGKFFGQALDGGIPITFVSTVCPAFTYDTSGKYDFKGLTDGPGLLGQIHLHTFRDLVLSKIVNAGLPFEYVVVVADIAEAYDNDVVDRFTGGDLQLLLDRCKMTASKLSDLSIALDIPNTSVFTMSDLYGISLDDYRKERESLNAAIINKARIDKEFGTFFKHYTDSRKAMQSLYISSTRQLNDEELEIRAASGISQYLHHFDFVRSEYEYPVALNHSTMSLRFANRSYGMSDGNIEITSAQKRIPIIELKTKVY